MLKCGEKCVSQSRWNRVTTNYNGRSPWLLLAPPPWLNRARRQYRGGGVWLCKRQLCVGCPFISLCVCNAPWYTRSYRTSRDQAKPWDDRSHLSFWKMEEPRTFLWVMLGFVRFMLPFEDVMKSVLRASVWPLPGPFPMAWWYRENHWLVSVRVPAIPFSSEPRGAWIYGGRNCALSYTKRQH